MFKLKTLVLDIANFADNLITPIKINTSGASSGDVISFDGTNAVWDAPAGGGSLTPLVTTFADCENTTDEIDIVTVTVPADTLAVGDVIIIDCAYNRLQNSGGSMNITPRFLNDASNMLAAGAGTIANNATTHRLFHKIKLFVTDITSNTATLNFLEGTVITGTVVDTNSVAIAATTAVNGVSTAVNANNTFDNTAGTTLKFSLQWASANANAYIRVQQAQAYIIKKAV
jgi:hypothetical protein